MTLKEGATDAIVSRWPEHRQINCALIPSIYPGNYCANMAAGIQLVRSHHDDLEAIGATTWSISPELSALLDELAEMPSVTSSPTQAP